MRTLSFVKLVATILGLDTKKKMTSWRNLFGILLAITGAPRSYLEEMEFQTFAYFLNEVQTTIKAKSFALDLYLLKARVWKKGYKSAVDQNFVEALAKHLRDHPTQIPHFEKVIERVLKPMERNYSKLFEGNSLFGRGRV